MKDKPQETMTVYYDGSCPSCVRDRTRYQKLSGKKDNQVLWFDITNKDQVLCDLGIDPKLALTELHIKTADGKIVSELDAYILLMQRTFWLKPLALILQTPVIKPLLAKTYHVLVNRRLKRSGRLP